MFSTAEENLQTNLLRALVKLFIAQRDKAQIKRCPLSACSTFKRHCLNLINCPEDKVQSNYFPYLDIRVRIWTIRTVSGNISRNSTFCFASGCVSKSTDLST